MNDKNSALSTQTSNNRRLSIIEKTGVWMLIIVLLINIPLLGWALSSRDPIGWVMVIIIDFVPACAIAFVSLAAIVQMLINKGKHQ